MYRLYINGNSVMKDTLENVVNKANWYAKLKIENKNFELKEMRIEKI